MSSLLKCGLGPKILPSVNLKMHSCFIFKLLVLVCIICYFILFFVIIIKPNGPFFSNPFPDRVHFSLRAAENEMGEKLNRNSSVEDLEFFYSSLIPFSALIVCEGSQSLTRFEKKSFSSFY